MKDSAVVSILVAFVVMMSYATLSYLNSPGYVLANEFEARYEAKGISASCSNEPLVINCVMENGSQEHFYKIQQ